MNSDTHTHPFFPAAAPPLLAPWSCPLLALIFSSLLNRFLRRLVLRTRLEETRPLSSCLSNLDNFRLHGERLKFAAGCLPETVFRRRHEDLHRWPSPTKSARPLKLFPAFLQPQAVLWWPFHAVPKQLEWGHLQMAPIWNLQIPHLWSVPPATAMPPLLQGVPSHGSSTMLAASTATHLPLPMLTSSRPSKCLALPSSM